MAVHVETISLQKDSVRRVLKSILPRIDQYLHGIELRLIPVSTYLTDDNMSTHLNRLQTNTVKYPVTSNNVKQIASIISKPQ